MFYEKINNKHTAIIKFNLYTYLHKEHASCKQTKLLCSSCNICYAVAPSVAVYVAISFLHYETFVVILTGAILSRIAEYLKLYYFSRMDGNYSVQFVKLYL